jgi:hypothetical protein
VEARWPCRSPWRSSHASPRDNTLVEAAFESQFPQNTRLHHNATRVLWTAPCPSRCANMCESLHEGGRRPRYRSHWSASGCHFRRRCRRTLHILPRCHYLLGCHRCSGHKSRFRAHSPTPLRGRPGWFESACRSVRIRQRNQCSFPTSPKQWCPQCSSSWSRRLVQRRQRHGWPRRLATGNHPDHPLVLCSRRYLRHLLLMELGYRPPPRPPPRPPHRVARGCRGCQVRPGHHRCCSHRLARSSPSPGGRRWRRPQCYPSRRYRHRRPGRFPHCHPASLLVPRPLPPVPLRCQSNHLRSMPYRLDGPRSRPRSSCCWSSRPRLLTRQGAYILLPLNSAKPSNPSWQEYCPAATVLPRGMR